ncbi:protein SAAL1 isoform X3 [Mauremys reevesii]|nr:protein SAAL1 isoform X3 [Mauremys reevesii]XP_039391393.1 protein SAAL1 isoform X3 [Mauremys reevesii]
MSHYFSKNLMPLIYLWECLPSLSVLDLLKSVWEYWVIWPVSKTYACLLAKMTILDKCYCNICVIRTLLLCWKQAVHLDFIPRGPDFFLHCTVGLVLLLTCLSQAEVANIWVERIRENPSVYDCVCFIMSSSTNVELLAKVGEVVDKLFDLDEELMLNWIKNGSCQSVGQSTDDSPEERPDFKIVPCVLEAAKQVRSDNPEGLDVYMHILQLLTTVDEGIQAIVQSPDGGKETWTLLYGLVCHELCQPDDPPIIIQEQKSVLASILSVLSAMFASQVQQEYVKRRKNMPLIGSLIRILQNMEDCGKRSFDNAKKSQPEETEKSGTVEEDFHLKILKDICCELLSNMLQELTKENILEGLNQGHLNEQKCSCAFQNLLPLYFTAVESFLEALREADQTLADSLEKRFPSLRLQT